MLMVCVAYQRYAVAASNPEYQAQNLDVFNFQLNETEVALLDAADKPSGCPFWPGSACWKMSTCTGCNNSTVAAKPYL